MANNERTTEDSLIPPHVADYVETWIDIGLVLKSYPLPPELYARLLRETELLLGSGQADLSFFIHKPPGLRWRLHAAEGVPVHELRLAATTAACRVVAQDLVRQAVYEPQRTLFGGALSMDLVHRTWHVDSMLWLRWHAENARVSLGAKWELSLGVLAHVYRGLGVVGWEDREVWSHVAQDTGRRLADHEWRRPEVIAVARAIRDRWNAVWGTPATPPRPDGDYGLGRTDEFFAQIEPLLAEWYSVCLSLPATDHPLTPRRAAAYWTVFHWNRVLFTGAQQALATQVLAGRPLAA